MHALIDGHVLLLKSLYAVSFVLVCESLIYLFFSKTIIISA